jgi:hypothetical protein
MFSQDCPSPEGKATYSAIYYPKFGEFAILNLMYLTYGPSENLTPYCRSLHCVRGYFTAEIIIRYLFS